MKTINYFLRLVDNTNKWSGEGVAWLTLLMSLAVGFDVVCRYVYGKATDWGYDVGWMLFAINFMIGAGYTFKEDGHVRVDLVIHKFSTRTRAILDIFYWTLFILPITILLIVYSIPYAAESWSIYERSAYSAWRPYIFPFKTIIPIAFILLSLQVIADIIRKFKIALGTKEKR